MVPPPGVLLRWGPGTTLNLLKFPIINPTPYRLFRRQERLQKDSQQSEEDLAPEELKRLQTLSKQGYLTGEEGNPWLQHTAVPRHPSG